MIVQDVSSSHREAPCLRCSEVECTESNALSLYLGQRAAYASPAGQLKKPAITRQDFRTQKKVMFKKLRDISVANCRVAFSDVSGFLLVL